MFLAMKYTGRPKFQAIFCGQNENINYYVSKVIGYAFVNGKNRKLRPTLLLTLRATFSTIRTQYPKDPLVNAAA